MAKGGTPFNKFFSDFWDDANKKIVPEQLIVAELFFNSLKREVIEKIRNTDVAQELANHTTPSAILGTPGSLFGFLGLIEGQDPVNEIIAIFENVMSFRISRRLKTGGIKLTIKVPDLKDFRENDLILPWQGGYSVVDAIEKGLSGLENYIAAKNLSYSRSGDGIQVKQTVRWGSFRGVKWISPILDEVKARAKTFR